MTQKWLRHRDLWNEIFSRTGSRISLSTTGASQKPAKTRRQRIGRAPPALKG
jgi:hypothetical protein